jgi:DNA-binding response OmpR family regulator
MWSILVAIADADLSESVVDILELEGYQASECDPLALHGVENHHLVIYEVDMLLYVNKPPPDITDKPVIFLASLKQKDLDWYFDDIQFENLLVKPFVIETLLVYIQNLLH